MEKRINEVLVMEGLTKSEFEEMCANVLDIKLNALEKVSIMNFPDDSLPHTKALLLKAAMHLKRCFQLEAVDGTKKGCWGC